MGYYVDERLMNLRELQTRIEETDLIPSHRPLLHGLMENMRILEETKIQSVADLRTQLKNKKALKIFAENTGISPDYLILLRRVIEGYFPKPQPLRTFHWLSKNTLAKLEQAGIKNTLHLYKAASSDIDSFITNMGLQKEDLLEYLIVSDLSRIQWIGPNFARVLVAANFTSTMMVAEANPNILYESIILTNKKYQFYKGNINLRDIKRLIVAASYVLWSKNR